MLQTIGRRFLTPKLSLLTKSIPSALLMVLGGPDAFLGENTRHHGDDEIKLNKCRFAPALCLYQKESTGTPRETVWRDLASSADSLEPGGQI